VIVFWDGKETVTYWY